MTLKYNLQKAADALGLTIDESDDSEEAHKKRRAQGTSDTESTVLTGQSYTDSVGSTSGADSTSAAHISDINTTPSHDGSSATDGITFSGATAGVDAGVGQGSGGEGNAGDAGFGDATASADASIGQAGSGSGASSGGDAGSSDSGGSSDAGGGGDGGNGS